MGSSENKLLYENSIPDEAKKILKSLVSSWDDVIDPHELQVIRLKGAMTNQVYQIKWPTVQNPIENQEHPKRSRKVLVRIYGEGVDVFFDRENEIRTFEFMSKKGQGPRLLGRFSNGRVEEFIRARTLSASDLRDPEISPLIAAKMKEFHDLQMPGPKDILLWVRLRNWLNVAKNVSTSEDAEDFRLAALQDEISGLQQRLSGNHQYIGFCHNDLQYGNIMIDEETRSITIIDYEYACYNPVAFDIANHFCEMAADYHTENPHILDYSKYPDLEERERFLRMYLSCSAPPVNIKRKTNRQQRRSIVFATLSQPAPAVDAKFRIFSPKSPSLAREAQPELLLKASPSSLSCEPGRLLPNFPVQETSSVDAMEYLTNILGSKVYDVASKTPLHLAPVLSERLGVNVWFKREDLQAYLNKVYFGERHKLMQKRRAEEEGRTFIPPFDHPARELFFLLLEQPQSEDSRIGRRGKHSNEFSDVELERFVKGVEKYTLASHLFWGLWGIISEHVNKIDFDYKEYARQRFEQYWLRKDELLGSS